MKNIKRSFKFLKTAIRIRIKHKQCNTCGHVHKKVPCDHKKTTDHPAMMGFWWDCNCKSTMFLRVK